MRMRYLLPQTIPPISGEPLNTEHSEQVHPVTDRMFGEFATKLGSEQEAARQESFAFHEAIFGLVLMFGLADSVKDPLKHTRSEMVDALIASFTSR